MKNKFRKLAGISLAVAMTVSLLPAAAFAENTTAATSEKSVNDNLLRSISMKKPYGTAVRPKITATDTTTVILIRQILRKTFKKSEMT